VAARGGGLRRWDSKGRSGGASRMRRGGDEVEGACRGDEAGGWGGQASGDHGVMRRKREFYSSLVGIP
jgi:hypothetical protein